MVVQFVPSDPSQPASTARVTRTNYHRPGSPGSPGKKPRPAGGAIQPLHGSSAGATLTKHLFNRYATAGICLDEGGELRRTAIKKVPIEHILHPVVRRIGAADVRAEKQAAWRQQIIKITHQAFANLARKIVEEPGAINEVVPRPADRFAHVFDHLVNGSLDHLNRGGPVMFVF